MSVKIVQAWDGIDLELESGSGSNSASSATIYYIVSGVEDDATACTSCYSFAPATFSGIPKKSVSLSERLTKDCWKVEVRYGTEDSGGGDGDDDNTPSMSFDCSAGTKHMTQAITQTCVFAASGETKEEEAEASAIPIGWNGKEGAESEAAGVDVPVGELRETYTKWMSKSKVTSTSWKKTVASLVGKVNSGSFKGWSAGEMMFLGCSYSTPTRNATKVQVSFHFSVRCNETKATIAGKSIGAKKGFEYLWALTSDAVQDGELVRTLRKVYKSEVSETDGFGGLGV